MVLDVERRRLARHVPGRMAKEGQGPYSVLLPVNLK